MISGEQQRLVIEKLYRSTDSITSTKKFNEKYADSIGPVGKFSMKMTDFARKMKETDFSSIRVERAMREVTGRSVDLEML
jgi:hypothetical protein